MNNKKIHEIMDLSDRIYCNSGNKKIVRDFALKIHDIAIGELKND